MIGKDEAAVKRHEWPRAHAVSSFIEAVGDMEIAAVTVEEMFNFASG